MTTDRRQRVLELYHQTLGTDTAGRDAFLLDACVGDEELHRQVQALLAHDHCPIRRSGRGQGRDSGSGDQHLDDHLSGASNALYLESGYLAYVAGGAVWAVPFDAGKRAISGTAVPVLNEVVTTGNGAGTFAVSANGTLVYAHASGFDPMAKTLNWIDRQGRVETIPAPPNPYSQPRLSYDGTRVVASTVRDPEDNLWAGDLTRRDSDASHD